MPTEQGERKVDVSDLRPGMYVCRLDRPWLESPFPFQGFQLNDWSQVHEVQAACEYVFIEIAKSDLSKEPAHESGSVGKRRNGVEATLQNRRLAPGRTREDGVQRSAWEEKIWTEAGRSPQAVRPPSISVTEEMRAAQPLIRQTRLLVAQQIKDARNGRSLDTPAARECVEQITESILRNPDALGYLSSLKKRDEYTYLHSLSVCILSVSFGRALGLPREALLELGLGAFLHDIGKMRIPDKLLNKPGRLAPVEFKLMRRHPEFGVEIVGGSERIPESSRNVIYSHHERLDGSGYTQGLGGGLINPLTHIVSVCDTYDAIISHRPYKRARSPLDATAELYRSRGRFFDAGLVHKFIGFVGVYPVGSLVELSTGEVGMVIATNEQRLRPKLLLLLDEDHQRLSTPHQVDLAHQFQTSDGRHLDVIRSLESGAHGLDPFELPRYMERT